MMNSAKSQGAASIGGGGQEDGGATASLGISSAEQLLQTHSLSRSPCGAGHAFILPPSTARHCHAQDSAYYNF